MDTVGNLLFLFFSSALFRNGPWGKETILVAGAGGGGGSRNGCPGGGFVGGYVTSHATCVVLVKCVVCMLHVVLVTCVVCMLHVVLVKCVVCMVHVGSTCDVPMSNGVKTRPGSHCRRRRRFS